MIDMKFRFLAITFFIIFPLIMPVFSSMPKKPIIMTREEWGANKPRCSFKEQPYYNMITIHHTATSNTYSDSYDIIKNIQKYHQQEKGWCDIGYNFLIDKEGRIFEGRPLWAIGAHVANHNVGNIGISLIGNFEKEAPSSKSIEALIELISWLVYKYNIPIGSIKGHRDFSNTLCPGKHLYRLIPLIKRKVASRTYGFGNGFGKAVWWGIYSDYWSSDKSIWEKQVDDAFKTIKEIGIDTVFFMVKDPWGYVYYNSSILPLSKKYSWDPLEYIVKMGKKYNISIHVYINALAEGDTKVNYFLKENPDIAIRDKNNKEIGWVDPASQKQISRITNIVYEILKKYDVDGIQLDRIRLPSNAYRLPLTEEEFKEKYGIIPSENWEKWIEFKASKITTFVKKIRETIKQINPDIRFSAAVIPDSERARTVLAQDWRRWLREGIVDFVSVMSYSVTLMSFENYMSDALDASNKTRPIYLGIGAFMNDMDKDTLQKEITLAFKNSNVYGVVIFNLDTLLKDENKKTTIKSIFNGLNYNLSLEKKDNSLIYFILGGVLTFTVIILFLFKMAYSKEKNKKYTRK